MQPENWDNFARLFKAGLEGIDVGRGQAPLPLIMLHYDNGADTDGGTAFLDRFNDYHIPYDIIGYSYYPWWHAGQGCDPGGSGLPAPSVCVRQVQAGIGMMRAPLDCLPIAPLDG
jgi:hypothetical protein